MMKMKLLAFVFISITLFTSTRSYAVPFSFIKIDNGVIVFPDPQFTLNTKAVKLQIIADNIIRVTASPQKEFPSVKSLITVYEKNSVVAWTIASTKETVTVKTKKLTAIVQLKTGAVSFFDLSGNKILAEKKPGGRSFEPTVFEGQRSYHITQAFQTTAADAYYGLGQHQNDVFNYKVTQVNLFQNNTEVGVPFLVSNKNYGILWDN